MNDTKLAKSLSYKTLAGLSEASDDEVKSAMKEFAKTDTIITQIAGEITGYSIKNAQYGENISFTGNFVARSAITGEIFETSKMFFDKGFSEQLRSQWDSRIDSGEIVKFSAEIMVIKFNKSPFYTYMARPLRTPEAITKRAELLSTLASAPLPVKIAAPNKKTA